MFFRVGIEISSVLYPLFTGNAELIIDNETTRRMRNEIIDYFDGALRPTYTYGIHWYTENGWRKHGMKSLKLASLFGIPVLFVADKLPSSIKYIDLDQVVIAINEMIECRPETIPSVVLNEYLQKKEKI